jgi:hypothetical protein
MIQSILNKYFLILIFLLLTACTGTKHLSGGEKLYTGAGINAESTERISRRVIKNISKTTLRPAPNKSYLGFRPKLWRYMAAGEDPKTRFGKWLKKTGEAPVLISSVKPEIIAANIDARLFNIGIFNGYSEYKTIEKKHTAKIIYTSHIHRPYTIKELSYRVTDDSINHIILAQKKKSLIIAGEDYDLDILKKERIRLDELLKNIGYFYFNPDYFLFKADTSAEERTISLSLTLKDSIPKNALIVYRIKNVFIDQDFSINEDLTADNRDTIIYRNNVFMGSVSEMKIRPRVILRSVFLKRNEIYSRHNHNITLNRLMSMGNFKFAQVKFSDSDTTITGLLDVTILLTTIPDRTVRAEIDIVSKSNNYTGPRMNLSILNRNTFKGAEQLTLNLAGSFEAQFLGNSKNLYSYNWNPQGELVFPRFLGPFKINKMTSNYIPKTRLLMSYNFMKRVNYFEMRTFQIIYGFKWRMNVKTEHELNPVNVSFTSIGNQSVTFTDLLASNPFLKKSYEDQFTAGMNYSFIYNEQLLTGKKVQYFIHATTETAGNLFSLVKSLGGHKTSSDNPSKVLGSIYSQYAKFSLDARVFVNFQDKNKIVFRFFAGIAKPYGNSYVLPYTKQFFSGGPNSIRAFQINSVGPGTYFQNVDYRGILQLGGDIKLEINSEYRFNIYRFIKGALFLDAGNVWLQKSNPSDNGSRFSISGFINEVAVGAGVGARIDVSFFILRFDLAMPLRKPWLEENHRWVTNQINFANSAWRRDNLVFNVAIGYPF